MTNREAYNGRLIKRISSYSFPFDQCYKLDIYYVCKHHKKTRFKVKSIILTKPFDEDIEFIKFLNEDYVGGNYCGSLF